MEVVITVTGTSEEIGRLLPRLGDVDVEFVNVRETKEWDLGYAVQLLEELHPNTLEIIDEVIGHHGEISAAHLRGSESGSLRGKVGPITKAMRRLEKAERLPTGLPTPLTALYESEGNSGGKAASIVMPPELLPVFAKAIVVARHSGHEVAR